MRAVMGSINDADVLVLVVDVFQKDFPHEKLLRQLNASPAAMMILLNKVRWALYLESYFFRKNSFNV